jgi:hypothetical protein
MATWLPTKIPGLQTWFKGDGSTVHVGSNNRITSWDDRSGNHIYATPESYYSPADGGNITPLATYTPRESWGGAIAYDAVYMFDFNGTVQNKYVSMVTNIPIGGTVATGESIFMAVWNTNGVTAQGGVAALNLAAVSVDEIGTTGQYEYVLSAGSTLLHSGINGAALVCYSAISNNVMFSVNGNVTSSTAPVIDLARGQTALGRAASTYWANGRFGGEFFEVKLTTIFSVLMNSSRWRAT